MRSWATIVCILMQIKVFMDLHYTHFLFPLSIAENNCKSNCGSFSAVLSWKSQFKSSPWPLSWWSSPGWWRCCSRQSANLHKVSVTAHDGAVWSFVCKMLYWTILFHYRDLIKWCMRSVQGFGVSSQDSALRIFKDALTLSVAMLQMWAQH